MRKTMFNVVQTTEAANTEAVKNLEKFKAVAFIKSRKADYKLHAMAKEMIDVAVPLEIDITDVIMDESADDDIDRVEVTDFCKTVEEMEADAVFVSDILDFTRDPDDLLKFLDNLLNRPVLIFDMKRHHAWIPKILDKSDSDEE